jgi:acylphosphatase
MMQNDLRWHAIVHGRVQGVGFRWFVMKTASRLEVAGWVRNNPDGSVELEAGGSSEAIAELKARVSRGPAVARVDRVDELPASAEVLPLPFEQR